MLKVSKTVLLKNLNYLAENMSCEGNLVFQILFSSLYNTLPVPNLSFPKREGSSIGI